MFRRNRGRGSNTVDSRCTVLPYYVTPAKAGVQNCLKRLDSGLRRNDDHYLSLRKICLSQQYWEV